MKELIAELISESICVTSVKIYDTEMKKSIIYIFIFFKINDIMKRTNKQKGEDSDVYYERH